MKWSLGDYVLDDLTSISRKSWEFFSSTPCPDGLWGLLSLLSKWHRVHFHGSKAAGA